MAGIVIVNVPSKLRMGAQLPLDCCAEKNKCELTQRNTGLNFTQLLTVFPFS